MKISVNYEMTEAEVARTYDILDRALDIASPLFEAYIRKAVKATESPDAASKAKKQDIMRGRLYSLAEKAVETAVKLAAEEAVNEKNE